MTPALEAFALRKAYTTPAGELVALNGVDLCIDSGEFVALMGASGSGKSTLLNILGCLDRPTSGTYRFNATDTALLDDRRLSHVRNRQIGFVFQSFNLLPTITIVSNVMLPMLYAGVNRRECERRAMTLIGNLGLGAQAGLHPAQLSGGQQQRVAIARALANDPAVLLADEPTGNLDRSAGADILNLLCGLNSHKGVTVVLVTHDSEVAARARRLVRIADGTVCYDGPSGITA